MAEYIEREAVRNTLYEADVITMNGLAILNRFPAADVVPVVRGRWDLLRQGGCTSLYACSVCQRKITLSGDLSTREPRLKKLYPYCHCGARMDGGVHNDDPVDGQATGG